LLEHLHGVNRRYLDLPAQRRAVEGVLEVLHRRQELFHEASIAEGHDLVADGDEDDLARGVEGDHVGVDPVPAKPFFFNIFLFYILFLKFIFYILIYNIIKKIF